MTLQRYVCNTTSSTSDIPYLLICISFCLLQRVLELDAHVIRHEFIYVDEVGFKTRRRGRNVIGQRAITNVPGQRGGNITMCCHRSKRGPPSQCHTGSVQHRPYAHFSGCNLHNALLLDLWFYGTMLVFIGLFWSKTGLPPIHNL